MALKTGLRKIILSLTLAAVFFCRPVLFGQTDEILGGGKYLIDGVLQGKYKKPGWREFIMPDRLEIGGNRYPAQTDHPRLLDDHLLTSKAFYGNSAQKQRWLNMTREAANCPLLPHYRRVKDWSPQAKAAAFLHRRGGEKQYLQKVIDLFLLIPEAPAIVDFEGGAADRDWGDYLQSAEPVPDLCVAYDLVYERLSPASREEFERKLTGLAVTLIDGLRYTPKNNHVVLMSAAVATIALTVDEVNRYSQYSRAEMLNLALEYLSEALGLIAPDGGYAEGPYYARYILNYLAPFSIHLKNAAGISLFSHPRLKRLVGWTLDNEKGGGNFTQFDDAFTTQFFFLPLLTDASDGSTRWEEYSYLTDQFTSYRPNMIEALLENDFQPPRARQKYPEYPGRFYADMGQAIFKDRAARPDFFASLLFEQPEYFADVHEHIDPLSVEISAGGEDFIIDGGYGAGTPDKDRPYFLSAAANSALLVDGAGINPNPISGDGPAVDLNFAFSTTRFAAVSASHQIGDATVSRTMFYGGQNLMLMIDEMSAASPRVFASQFNYLGELTEKSGEKLSWQKNGARLDFLRLNDFPDRGAVFTENGLHTVGSHTLPAGKAIVEMAEDFSSLNAGIWAGHKAGENLTGMKIVPTSGAGEILRIGESPARWDEFARNNGQILQTPDWESDGKFIWIQKDGPRAGHVLMLEGRRIKTDQLEIQFSRPVMLYLERRNMAWRGYLHLTDAREKTWMTISSNMPAPARMNGTPLAPNMVKNKRVYEISGSGELTFGFSGEPLYLAKKSAPDAHFLERISQNPVNTQPAEFWSDYQQTQFKNEITTHLLEAGDEFFKYSGETYFDNPLIFHHALNAGQGLLQYGYRSSNDGRGFRLPHVYAGEFERGESRFHFREEGDWRRESAQVRSLDLDASHRRESRLNYSYRQNFTDQHSHLMHLRYKKRASLSWRENNYRDEKSTQWNLEYRGKNWGARPSLTYAENDIQNYDLSLRRENLSGYVHSNKNESFQQIRGRLAKTQWMMSGRQQKHGRRQQYEQSLAGKIFKKNSYFLLNQLERGERWKYARGILQLSGPFAKGSWTQALQYYRNDWFYAGNMLRSSGANDISLGVSLQNGEIGETGYLQATHDRYFNDRDFVSSQINYRYSGADGIYQSVLRQEYSIAIHPKLALMPAYQLRLNDQPRVQSIGGGFYSTAFLPIYFSLERFRISDEGYIQASLSALLQVGYPLKLWTRALLDEEQFLSVECSFSPAGAGQLQPGVFYRFIRGREQRLEGALQWRW